MYTMLLSGDLMVHDADHVADLLVNKLGIHGHPNWRQGFGNHPYVAHFLRPHKSLAVSPTRVEPQGHLDMPNVGDPMFPVFLKSLEDFQGPFRPIKTHATVLVIEDLGRIIERLERRNQPFRLAQITPEMPFDRLWVGCTPENPVYQPSVDGGLCIEIMPLAPLQMPADTFNVPPPEPRGIKEGDMVRTIGRGFLVRNLDDTLTKLSANLDFEPNGPVQTLNKEGYKVATMGFSLANSSTLDIIQPTKWDSLAGRYIHNWGPGPYYIRISVNGLKAKAEQLKEKGVAFDWVEESESAGGSLIRIDPAELDGAIIEFVEHKG
jgi:hypothetical protein